MLPIAAQTIVLYTRPCVLVCLPLTCELNGGYIMGFAAGRVRSFGRGILLYQIVSSTVDDDQCNEFAEETFAIVP